MWFPYYFKYTKIAKIYQAEKSFLINDTDIAGETAGCCKANDSCRQKKER